MSESKLLVITYHYIRRSGGIYDGIHPCTPEQLDSDISLLKKKYSPATLDEVNAFILEKKPLSNDSFFITFDDGLCDHYYDSKPILDKHGLKAAFFVPTLPIIESKSPTVHKIHWLRAHTKPEKFNQFLRRKLPDTWSNIELSDSDKHRASCMHIHDQPTVQQLKFALNFLIPHKVVDQVMSELLHDYGIDEKDFCEYTFMSTSQIKELADEGHIIGMHGHSHIPLTSFTNSEAICDLTLNKKNLKEIIGKPVTWLSYPYGRPDAVPENVKKICETTSVDIGYSLISGFISLSSDRYCLKRITPNEIRNYMD